MPSGISIGSAVFAGLIPVTYRHTHTDRATPSVATGRIYMLCITMRPKNITTVIGLKHQKRIAKKHSEAQSTRTLKQTFIEAVVLCLDDRFAQCL